MSQPRQTLLLIEDNLGVGSALQLNLEDIGYTVDWFVDGEIIADGLILHAADRTKTPLVPSRYSVALVDGQLEWGTLNGWDLAPAIINAGLPVIGISSDARHNQKLSEAGARDTVDKGRLLQKIKSGDLQLTRTLKRKAT